MLEDDDTELNFVVVHQREDILVNVGEDVVNLLGSGLAEHLVHVAQIGQVQIPRAHLEELRRAIGGWKVARGQAGRS